MPPITPPDFGGLTQAALPGRGARVVTVDLFLGPPGLSYTAAKQTNGGLIYTGRIQPGTAKDEFSRTLYQLMTGLPKTAKEGFVTGIDGKFSCNLIDITGKTYEIANGGDPGVPIFLATPVATTVAATPAPAVDSFGLTATTDLKVGSQIEVVTTNGKEYTYITKITGTTIEVFPRLSVAPASAAAVKRVDGWEEPLGTATLTYYSMLAVTSQADGSQILVWSPKVSSNGIKSDYPDGKEMSLPLELTCYGFTDPVYNGPIVGKRYTLNKEVAIPLNT